MEPAVIQVPPFSLSIDGVEATILEVLKTQLISGDVWYHVVVKLRYKGIDSRNYTLDVKDMNNLVDKLKVEVSKIRFIELAYGINEVKRIMYG